MLETEGTDFEKLKYIDHSLIGNQYLDKVTGNAIALYGVPNCWTMHILNGYKHVKGEYKKSTHEEEIYLNNTTHFRFRLFPEIINRGSVKRNGSFLIEGIEIKCVDENYLDIVKLDIDSIEYRFMTQVLNIDKS